MMACLSLLGFLAGSGCISINNTPYRLQPVEIPSREAAVSEQNSLIQSIMEPGPEPLKPGDGIRVLTLDGERRILKVVAVDRHSITAKSLFSRQFEIPTEDIVFLEKDVKKGTNWWSLFPLPEKENPGDHNLTCQEIESELVRRDVLRRAINEEITLLQWEMATTFISLVAIHDQPRIHLKKDELARDAVDARMVRLIFLCQSHGCSNLPSSGRKSDCAETWEAVDLLRKELESGSLEKKEHEKQLRQVLDTLF